MPAPTAIHHDAEPPTVTDDWYDYVFAAKSAKIGDWWWSREIGWHDDDPTEPLRVLWLIVPIRDERRLKGSYGPLSPDGAGELIRIYTSHEGPTVKHPSGNWAAPGPVDGWDGDVDAPTLRPSIWVGGSSDYPGWHGYLTDGKLSNA